MFPTTPAETRTARTARSARRAARLRARTLRALEGPHRWGRYEQSATAFTARTGVCERRLTVYAPGATSADRRLITLWHAWPLVGGALAFAVALLLAPAAPIAALVGMLTLYLGGLALVARRSRRARAGCRVIRCSAVALSTGREAIGDARLLDDALAELLRLERLREAGRIDEVGFELGWARVHDRLSDSD